MKKPIETAPLASPANRDASHLYCVTRTYKNDSFFFRDRERRFSKIVASSVVFVYNVRKQEESGRECLQCIKNSHSYMHE